MNTLHFSGHMLQRISGAAADGEEAPAKRIHRAIQFTKTPSPIVFFESMDDFTEEDVYPDEFEFDQDGWREIVDEVLYLLAGVPANGELTLEHQRAILKVAKELCQKVGKNTKTSIICSCYWLVNLLSQKKTGDYHDGALDSLRAISHKDPHGFWDWQSAMRLRGLRCPVRLEFAPKARKRIYIRNTNPAH